MTPGKPSNLRQAAELLRLPHYIKNVLVFAPLFFAGEGRNLPLLSNATLAFIAFSLAASGIYILNDCFDVAQDREHPKKKMRPIASGWVSVRLAIVLCVSLFLASGLLMVVLSMYGAEILGIYVLLNVAYSFLLKHVAILDVTVIATGFVLRLYVGAAVTDIELSMWIVVITFLFALFLAFAKRRNDVLLFLDTGAKARKAVDGYSLRFLDTAMAIMASVVIVSYILYTTSAEVLDRIHGNYLYLTALFVILGILRYMQIAFVNEDAGSPTDILWKDRFIQADSACWVLAFAWILYSG